jgi:hypothetical protein
VKIAVYLAGVVSAFGCPMEERTEGSFLSKWHILDVIAAGWFPGVAERLPPMVGTCLACGGIDRGGASGGIHGTCVRKLKEKNLINFMKNFTTALVTRGRGHSTGTM